MKRLHWLFAAALLPLLPAPGQAQFIWINLSFKAILNPTNGARLYAFGETNVDATIAKANEWLASYQRGYRFQRVGPIVNVGGINDTTGPSKYYDADTGGAALNNLDADAKSHPQQYAWNSNAVNYYVKAGMGRMVTDWAGRIVGVPAGNGGFPSQGLSVVALGTVDDAETLLHETGHHFELYHTHGGCSCGPGANGSLCASNYAGCFKTNGCYSVGRNDMTDVLADAECLDPEKIARANFGKGLAACADWEIELVNDTYRNIMSYHPPAVFSAQVYTNEVRLTEQQADKWTDMANSARWQEMSGVTRFVSSGGWDDNPGLHSTAPKRTLRSAAAASGWGDIVLLRPGNYNERLTISNAVTLRTPRRAWATIGRP